MKALLGQLFTRRLSWRRLLAFAVATGLLVAGVIGEQSWVILAVAFIGGEAAQHIANVAYGTSTPSPAPEGDSP